jgi:hypothetical protein
VYYNITITGLSVAVAFFIGTVELFGLLGQEAHLHGWVWDRLAGFNINRAGFFIVGIFVVVWAVALGVWRFGRIEARWEATAEASRQRRSIESARLSGLDALDEFDEVGELQPEPA